VLGVDEDGREILTWIEGEAGTEPPVRIEIASDQTLVDLAELIRAFHDASTNFTWTDGGWNDLLRDPSGSDEVICHNDLSITNTVFRPEGPIAIVDWEFASPGSRLWDLAYAAWWLVPLHRPEFCQRVGWPPVDQPRRLRLLCDAYGLERGRAKLLDVIHERQRRNQEQLRLWISEGIIPAFDQEDPSMEAGKTDYADGRRREFEAALAS
jgi:hypothetical protein